MIELEQETLAVEGTAGREVARTERGSALPVQANDQVAGLPVKPGSLVEALAGRRVHQMLLKGDVAQIFGENKAVGRVGGEDAGHRSPDRLQNPVIAEQGCGGGERLGMDDQDGGL